MLSYAAWSGKILTGMLELGGHVVIFVLEIPADVQKERLKLVTLHQDYEIWESFVYPGTGQAVEILLNRK